jgi:hypothetical protein
MSLFKWNLTKDAFQLNMNYEWDLQIIFEKVDGEKLAVDFCWWIAARRLNICKIRNNKLFGQNL